MQIEIKQRRKGKGEKGKRIEWGKEKVTKKADTSNFFQCSILHKVYIRLQSQLLTCLKIVSTDNKY